LSRKRFPGQERFTLVKDNEIPLDLCATGQPEMQEYFSYLREKMSDPHTKRSDDKYYIIEF